METNIYNKIYKLQQEIGAISKDVKNPFYKSKYFDVNSLIGQLKPLLEKYKLVLVQPITDNHVRSVIVDLDGGSIESAIELPKNLDAQKMGSAITYYRRYTLQSLLALQAVDDDGNLAVKPSAPPKLYKNTPEYKIVKAAVVNGKATMQYIKRKYTLTEDIEKELNKIITDKF